MTASDVQAAMIWDGAGFHRANDLKVPANITLIPLPPYSPELNGIENLWHDLRSHCWSNRAYRLTKNLIPVGKSSAVSKLPGGCLSASYEKYDDLFEVASRSWCQHCLNTDLIKSVCDKSYIPTRS